MSVVSSDDADAAALHWRSRRKMIASANRSASSCWSPNELVEPAWSKSRERSASCLGCCVVALFVVALFVGLRLCFRYVKLLVS